MVNEVEQQQEGEIEDGGHGRELQETECNIDVLNNDCLMHIFSLLSYRERIGIERGKLFHVTNPIYALLRSVVYPFAEPISSTCARFHQSCLIDFGCSDFKRDFSLVCHMGRSKCLDFLVVFLANSVML
jgi:hypothetical protein